MATIRTNLDKRIYVLQDAASSNQLDAAAASHTIESIFFSVTAGDGTAKAAAVTVDGVDNVFVWAAKPATGDGYQSAPIEFDNGLRVQSLYLKSISAGCRVTVKLA